MSFLYWNISLVLSFCFVYMSAGEDSGELPAPVDAKILWESHFCPILNWTKPNISEKCVVNYTIDKHESGQSSNDGDHRLTDKTQYRHNCMSHEKTVTFYITTVPVPDHCPKYSRSKPAILHVHRLSVEVKDFRFMYYTQQTVNWTWQPIDDITNLQSYYSFLKEGMVSQLERCPQGIFRGLQLIGCHVNSSTLPPEMFILVNGTRGNDVINATFHRILRHNYKLPPPEVSVGLQKNNQLVITFSKPDFPNYHCFQYQVNYTECGKPKSELVSDKSDEASAILPYSVSYNSKCTYSVWVTSLVVATCGSGESEPSQRKDYGSASELSVVLVVVCVCVLLWICALLFFFYRYKERLLPKIPEPHLDSFKGLMERLYVPAPERVEINLELCPSNTDVAQHTT
ncbi:interleukin-13 receptor subunit alpha-1 [Sardina pilchardus]|uniref:interleukin-13 receptor subunit alpha-1 n=1 Tax=Sardina pilchardus TaxID=27697 RepID=UPI002E13B794